MGRSPMTVLSRLSIMVALLCGVMANGVTHAQGATCGDHAAAASPSATTADGWVAQPELPRPRSEFGAATIGEWIYVVGGFGGGAMLDCFHPASGTWATGPDLPVGVHHPGVTALDGILYIAGGYTDEGVATGALRAFDPATGEWESRAAMPTARGALGLVAHEGRLYAVGGATQVLSGPVTGAVEIYDPTNDRWSRGAPMPTPREHLAVVEGDGGIYAIGGRANGSEEERFASAAEVYDPATDSWEALPPLPTPRGGLSGGFLEGQVVVLGGERGTTAFDTVEAFDVTDGAWRELEPLPTPRHGVAVTVLEDTLYAIGGSTIAGVAENTGESSALTLP